MLTFNALSVLRWSFRFWPFPFSVLGNAVPTIPVPAQIATAKKIFISYGGTPTPFPHSGWEEYSGDHDRAYYEFYTAIKGLGRYELQSKPGSADLVFEIGMEEVGLLFELRFRIFDPSTHTLLWGVSSIH